MGSKRLTAQYEARITELKEAHARQVATLEARIEDLRQLAIPNKYPTLHIPVIAAEADAIMTPGVEASIEMTPDQAEEWNEVQSEADRLFAGTY